MVQIFSRGQDPGTSNFSIQGGRSSSETTVTNKQGVISPQKYEPSSTPLPELHTFTSEQVSHFFLLRFGNFSSTLQEIPVCMGCLCVTAVLAGRLNWQHSGVC